MQKFIPVPAQPAHFLLRLGGHNDLRLAIKHFRGAIAGATSLRERPFSAFANRIFPPDQRPLSGVLLISPATTNRKRRHRAPSNGLHQPVSTPNYIGRARIVASSWRSVAADVVGAIAVDALCMYR